MRALHTLAVGLGSFLLFLVEPIAARALLPAYGGAPAVWNSALLFFQLALLGGYAWAHFAGGRRTPHVILLGLGTAYALYQATRWASLGSAHLPPPIDGVPPALGVMATLALLIGLPFLALSAGSSILQRWFARSEDPAAGDPYFLYAASNVGSLGALLAYPFLWEPRVPLSRGFVYWAIGLVLLFGLVLLCAKARGTAPEPPRATVGEGAPAKPLLWVALSAVPSALLMGVTGFVTVNVAPIPLLWIVPLALYLLTYVLAFSGRVRVPSTALGRFLPLLAAPLAILVVLESTDPRYPVAAVHGIVFFLACWMCHRRLAELRPPPADLTRYFFLLSLGGVIGGAFVALLAPLLFPVQFEYPLALAAALALRPAIRESKLLPDAGIVLGLTAIAALAIALSLRFPPGPLRIGIGVGIPVALAFWTMDFPVRFAGALLGLFAASALLAPASAGKIVFVERSFFGVHRVVEREGGRFRDLVHGSTTHGIQDRRSPRTPLTYYHPTGPAGQAFLARRLGEGRRVGLVGLGVGSLAAYGRPNDRFTVFEIDPAVIDIARDRGLFTFLRDSRAAIRYRLGDARLTVAGEPDETFDLLVLDAFTADSVPVHLLTREALTMFRRKVAPGGAILLHVSNRFIDLEPVVGRAAADAGWVAAVQEDGTTDEEARAGKTQSRWMILARTPEDVRRIGGKFWTAGDVRMADRAWTDDRADILSHLKGEGE